MNEFKSLFGDQYLQLNPEAGSIQEIDSLLPGNGEKYQVFKLKGTILFNSGIILSGDGIPIRDCFFYDYYLDHFLKDLVEKSGEINGIETGEEEYAPIFGLWDQAFWHWFMEYLPRVMLAEESGFTGKYLVSLNAPFKLDSLLLAGIPVERLVGIGPEDNYFVKNLVLPERIYPYSVKPILPLLKKLREKLLSASGAGKPSGRRLYISRKNAANGRNIVNEAELLRVLEKLNFETIFLENLSIKEQIRLTSSAECLIGANGAGMVHTLFMPPGSLVVELYSPVYVNYTTNKTVELLRHNYFPLTSQVTEKYPHGSSHTSPIEAPVDLIRITLENQLLYKNREPGL